MWPLHWSRPVLTGFLQSWIGPVRFFEVLGLWWTSLGLGLSPWRPKTETGPDFQSLHITWCLCFRQTVLMFLRTTANSMLPELTMAHIWGERGPRPITHTGKINFGGPCSLIDVMTQYTLGCISIKSNRQCISFFFFFFHVLCFICHHTYRRCSLAHILMPFIPWNVIHSTLLHCSSSLSHPAHLLLFFMLVFQCSRLGTILASTRCGDLDAAVHRILKAVILISDCHFFLFIMLNCVPRLYYPNM